VMAMMMMVVMAMLMMCLWWQIKSNLFVVHETTI